MGTMESKNRIQKGDRLQMEKWARIKYQPNLPLKKNGERVTASKEHIEISKEAAKEGMVLLKNEGILPLSEGSRIALFGKGTFDYVKGGGGSGDVYCPYIHNLCDGFAAYADEVTLFEATNDFYRKYVRHAYAKGGVPGLIEEPALPDELLKSAAAFADTAIISLSRFSGEGWDRKSSLGAPTPSVDDDPTYIESMNQVFRNSDFYLTEAEEAMIDKVKTAFDRVVVVLNVGGMVDVSWIKDDDLIGGALLAWQGGMEGGLAAAELLLGHGNPSGRLADTFARTIEDYPSSRGFHESGSYVNYSEDIYVGYRYFETIPGARKAVVYPFGYGLSYTDFALSSARLKISSGKWESAEAVLDCSNADFTVDVSVIVTNRGSCAGRDVVELYAEAPQGVLGKAKRSLVAYKKTRELAPGESETVFLTVDPYLFSSYDDIGKVRKAAYVLEAGNYHFHIGHSVEDTVEVTGSIHFPETIVVRQLTTRLAPAKLAERMRADGSMEKLPVHEQADPDSVDIEPISDEERNVPFEPARNAAARSLPFWYPITDDRDPRNNPQLIDVAEGRLSLDEFMSIIPDEGLASLCAGQPNTGVANTYGWGNLPDFGVPNAMTEDGPAGVRIMPGTGIRTTAFPCSTLLACTWDPEVTRRVGRAGGEELKENNLAVWLAPAVNIHRSPLCGRNFEYYSEDPLLAGRQAVGMVEGIQSNHVAVSLKHFALNNKESNRKNSDSRCSERAIREIYLKQFEIVVKEAHPWSVMSSYNYINGVRASESADLLNGILREEWGFDGLVTTDWWNHADSYKECKAGNDVKMGCGFPERLLYARNVGALSREELETAARHVIELILKLD